MAPSSSVCRFFSGYYNVILDHVPHWLEAARFIMSKNIGPPVERLVGAMAKAQGHWQESSRRKARGQTATAITIALTREAGAPGTSVARALGERLGWQVYDQELLELIAREMGLRVNLLETVDERRRNWLEETVERLAAVPTVSQNAYVRQLIETILSLGAHGECIIVGRGAAAILPLSTTLRVRLVGPVEERIAALGQRLGLSRAEAARHVEQADRNRVSFVLDHFRQDPRDLSGYDLILNFARWSVPECAEVIIGALGTMQRRFS
jgi:cytidylate kinase